MADDDVEFVVFERGVEEFLERGLEAVKQSNGPFPKVIFLTIAVRYLQS